MEEIKVESDSKMREALVDQVLPFNDAKQKAFFAYLLDPTNGLFKQVAPFMTADWFSHPDMAKLFNKLQKYSETTKFIPTLVEFRDSEALVSRDLSETNRLRDTLNICAENKTQYRYEALRGELVAWMQAKTLHTALRKSLKEYNNADWTAGIQVLKDSINQFDNINIDRDLSKKFSDVHEIVADMSETAMVPFGIGGIDKHLRPGCEKGGLRKGDTTLLIAPSNAGKTTVMLTTIAHNVRVENRVFLMTHEDTDTNIRVRLTQSYLCMMDAKEVMKFIPNVAAARAEILAQALNKMGSTYHTLVSYYQDHGQKDPVSWSLLSAALAHLDKWVKYVPYNSGTMEIEDVVPIINKAQQECIDTYGKGFDLFVNDYPAKLQTRRSSKGGYEVRHTISYVYDVFVQLALQYKWHSLVAIQANREGSKINKSMSKGENRLVSHEDVSEAWGPVTTASNIMTINRTPSGVREGRTTFFLTKTRSAMTGLAVSVRSDFGRAITHSDVLGWVSYCSDYEVAGVCHAHLKAGANVVITAAELIATRALRMESSEDKDEITVNPDKAS